MPFVVALKETSEAVLSFPRGCRLNSWRFFFFLWLSSVSSTITMVNELKSFEDFNETRDFSMSCYVFERTFCKTIRIIGLFLVTEGDSIIRARQLRVTLKMKMLKIHIFW